MYKIVKKINCLNREKKGVIWITDIIGNIYELTSWNGFISYVSIQKFNKLIKEKKIKKL